MHAFSHYSAIAKSMFPMSKYLFSCRIRALILSTLALCRPKLNSGADLALIPLRPRAILTFYPRQRREERGALLLWSAKEAIFEPFRSPLGEH
jgi:hypothetical protein